MSFRFKIFLFLTAIISIIMLLVYLYAIGVVEDDRRNFINEYMENISVNESLRVSFAVKNMRRISSILCFFNYDEEEKREDLKDFVNRIVLENGLAYFSLKKGKISIGYKKLPDISFDKMDDGAISNNRYIVVKSEVANCRVVSAIDSQRILTVRSEWKDGRVLAVAIADNLLVLDQIKQTVSDILVRVKSISQKSRSGVFQNDEYVIGYAIDEVEDITTLFMIRKEFFERAIISLRYRILFAGFVTLTLFLVIGFFIAGRITRPMQLLQEKSHRISQGIFEKVDVSVPSDEIGDAVAAFNRMIEDLKAKEENLKESQMRLIQAEKLSAFGQLSAGIAHEVKNPLTSVMGYIQLARRIERDEKINEYLKIAENETVRCRQILDDLLKFARMDRHQKSEVNISEVVESTVKLVNHQLVMKKIRLDCPAKRVPIIVYGSANQLQQVLLNILINAMQSIERKGTADGEISIDERVENGDVAISVRDNGEGISEENIGKIFEPFFTTKSDTGGTGLGLSISYGIIREHNGSIRVLSKVGEGTEFIITLPLRNQA